MIIHELAEHLLYLAKNENQSDEIAITYNLDNSHNIENGMNEILENVGICYGSENETSLFSDTKTMSIINRAKNIAVVNLHNHPSCGTFSLQDISFFLKETAIKLMIVLGNNGELYYLSKDLNKYNYIEAREYLINATKTVSPGIEKVSKKMLTYNEMKEISNLFLKSCKSFGIGYRHILGTEKPLQQVKEFLNLSKDEDYVADRDDY